MVYASHGDHHFGSVWLRRDPRPKAIFDIGFLRAPPNETWIQAPIVDCLETNSRRAKPGVGAVGLDEADDVSLHAGMLPIGLANVNADWLVSHAMTVRYHMTMEKGFGDRVFEAMEARGWTARELSRRSGVSYDVLTKMRTRPGSSTSAENAARLFDALGLAPDGAGSDRPAGDLVPVFEVEASAGHGIIVNGESEVARIAFPPGYLTQLTRTKPEHLAIIGVHGDSMVPTLADDDLVMIDRAKRDLSFDGLFVLRDGGDSLLVKRIGRASRAGMVSLISDNRAMYPTVERAVSEIEVVGRVIWAAGRI